MWTYYKICMTTFHVYSFNSPYNFFVTYRRSYYKICMTTLHVYSFNSPDNFFCNLRIHEPITKIEWQLSIYIPLTPHITFLELTYRWTYYKICMTTLHVYSFNSTHNFLVTYLYVNLLQNLYDNFHVYSFNSTHNFFVTYLYVNLLQNLYDNSPCIFV